MQEPLLIDPPGEKPLGVLLVEDSAADARLVEEELRQYDEVALSWVRSLEEARAALAARPFDAVLLDLLLPDARGIDLIDGVRGLAGDAALLVLSGQSPDDLLMARAAIRKGAEDFLPKDARAPHLLPRMITTAVERRRRAGALIAEAAAGAPTTALDDGGWRCCIATGRLDLSAAAARLLGLTSTPGELSLASLLDRLPGKARRSLLRLWSRLGSGQAKVALMLFDNASPAPGLAPQDTLIEARACRDGDGRIVAVEGALFDVTAARRLDRLHDAVITQLAHELRTPLTTIRAALGLLHGGLGEPMPHGSGGLLDRAVQNADRLAQILDELLVHAPAQKLEPRQKRRVPMADLSVLHDFLSQAVAAHQPAAFAAGISLRLDVVPSTTDAGEASDAIGTEGDTSIGHDAPADVALIIDALLADALRRSAPAGRVGVGLDRQADGAWLTVESSAGQATDHPSTRTATSACHCRLDGQHLAILERLIERVGGRIVESPDVASTAWRVFLPLAA